MKLALYFEVTVELLAITAFDRDETYGVVTKKAIIADLREWFADSGEEGVYTFKSRCFFETNPEHVASLKRWTEWAKLKFPTAKISGIPPGTGPFSDNTPIYAEIPEEEAIKVRDVLRRLERR